MAKLLAVGKRQLQQWGKGWAHSLLTPCPLKAYSSLRKTKTDRVDAFLIAEYARFKNLGPSRVSPEDAEGLKQLTRYRHHLVAERTALKNRLTSVADRIFPELAGLFSDRHSATARAILGEYGVELQIADAVSRPFAAH